MADEINKMVAIDPSAKCLNQLNNKTVIKQVEEHPCLWDKSDESYRDRMARKNAWNKVCQALNPSFSNWDQKTQDDFTYAVSMKYTNLRDSFMRSLKTKPINGVKRQQYMYADALKFLLKNVIAEDEPHSSKADDVLDLDRNELRSSANEQGGKRPRLDSFDQVASLDQIDEDQAFFLSLVPRVKAIPDEDKLDFRIEVMNLVKMYTKNSKELTKPHVVFNTEVVKEEFFDNCLNNAVDD